MKGMTGGYFGPDAFLRRQKIENVTWGLLDEDSGTFRLKTRVCSVSILLLCSRKDNQIENESLLCF